MRWSLGVFALFLLPPAHALQLEVAGPDILEPDQTYPVDLDITLDCVLVLTQAAPRLELAASSEGPVVTGPSSIALEREDCAGRDALRVQAGFNVTGGMDVPAEERVPLRFTATMADESDEAVLPVEMAYVGGFTAHVLHAHKQAGPQKVISYEVHLQSHANARTVISFSAEAPGQGHLVLPDEVILDMPGTPDGELTVVVQYSTPFENGANHAQEDLLVTVRSASVQEGTAGDEQTLDLRATTKGFYVPGPLPLAALAAAALLRRPAP